ncbi:MAG: hypothetical protein FJ301_08275 [Planctomycetes bacterium]|nr:hypothetical protein [Planctomycetota bacterium]
MRALLRWMLTTLGGLVAGVGVTLHSQVAFARFLQDEVDGTFFVWRAIGRATFWFQGESTQLALAMAEVPASALRASDIAAWTLVAVGGLVAFAGLLLPRHAPPPAKGRRGR